MELAIFHNFKIIWISEIICFEKWNYENRLRGFRYFKETPIIIMRQAWKMYFEDSGVSKHKLGGMREYGIRDKNILGCAECAHFN